MGGILDLPDDSLGISLERAGDHNEADEFEVTLQHLPLDLPGLWTNMGRSYDHNVPQPCNSPSPNDVLSGEVREGLVLPVAQQLGNGWVVPAPVLLLPSVGMPCPHRDLVSWLLSTVPC